MTTPEATNPLELSGSHHRDGLQFHQSAATQDWSLKVNDRVLFTDGSSKPAIIVAIVTPRSVAEPTASVVLFEAGDVCEDGPSNKVYTVEMEKLLRAVQVVGEATPDERMSAGDALTRIYERLGDKGDLLVPGIQHSVAIDAEVTTNPRELRETDAHTMALDTDPRDSSDTDTHTMVVVTDTVNHTEDEATSAVASKRRRAVKPIKLGPAHIDGQGQHISEGAP